jgi:hypothetical protein
MKTSSSDAIIWTKARGIRNDVMHFDPDPLPDSDLDALRHFAQFLQRLQTLGVT